MTDTPADTRPDRLVAVEEGEVTVAGVRSPYLHAGPADADEAVVFVHGNPGPAEDWRRLLARTGAFARAVAPDMPGFGGADKPDSFVYTVDGYARHLAGVLDGLGIRRAHLVLHDFGGAWGLWWAADHPDRFASATLVGIGVLRGYRWHSLARIWRTSGVGEAFFRASSLPAPRWLARRGSPPGLPDDAVERLGRGFRDPGTQRAVLRLYRATDMAAVAEDLHKRLQGSDRPVLAVWGRRDPYLPVAYAERQRETFPRAEVVVLDGSGHWPMLDDPVGLEATVLPFLERVTSTSRTPVAGPG
ncbi:pimeloyl-ACP methyl ester carboxylesterase [Geodermatophilus bullaregiensis]|uniref:alpha/beta fold hydrolase n=1 Tax=Geodermatophilus bullaregiensis TaxID=1564160 RepID=UPI001959A96D|nr:alpha/beta hydrolase [Geodermatophilus bullaregiensis]MBM7807684.1 pimeloyl-ACP methyl ester carboxylesterase [Geodermatophilus bullaregiensis]